MRWVKIGRRWWVNILCRFTPMQLIIDEFDDVYETIHQKQNGPATGQASSTAKP